MRIEVNLIVITFTPENGNIAVLLDKDRLPSQTISVDTLQDVLNKLTTKYIKIDPKFVQFNLTGCIHDKTNKRLKLYYYCFLPSPVPNRKGVWETAWEVYREAENAETFQIIQEASGRAYQRLQAGIR